MREKKYKAWNELLKEWVRVDKSCTLSATGIHPIDCVKLVESTGLKDKNGKEIYEGDIVLMLATDWASKSNDDPRTIEQYMRDKAYKYVVRYNQDEGIYQLDYVEDEFYSNDLNAHKPHGFIEVIGNIYENPELKERT